jgi:hypothetical protein
MAATSKTGSDDIRLTSSLAGGLGFYTNVTFLVLDTRIVEAFRSDRGVQLQVGGGVL